LQLPAYVHALIGKLKERGNECEEINNLSIALNQSNLMLIAIKELKEYKSNTANVLGAMGLWGYCWYAVF
jgi:hypothetical protein